MGKRGGGLDIADILLGNRDYELNVVKLISYSVSCPASLR